MLELLFTYPLLFILVWCRSHCKCNTCHPKQNAGKTAAISDNTAPAAADFGHVRFRRWPSSYSCPAPAVHCSEVRVEHQKGSSEGQGGLFCTLSCNSAFLTRITFWQHMGKGDLCTKSTCKAVDVVSKLQPSRIASPC